MSASSNSADNGSAPNNMASTDSIGDAGPSSGSQGEGHGPALNMSDAPVDVSSLPAWASRVGTERWIRPLDGQSCLYPAVFSAPGGPDLAARVKSALRAAGFRPETIGTPGADGLLVGAIPIVRDPDRRLHPTGFERARQPE